VAEERDGTLPEPDSEELASLLGSTTQRLLYQFLYRRRDNPPTMAEVRFFLTDALGESQEHVGRRMRELRRYFRLDVQFVNAEHRYVLTGWTKHRPPEAEAPISNRRRAQVLASQRCAQCGRTPLEDHVKLVVDHKIPQSWGGNNELENLQPLCEECNAGKRDYFQSFEAKSEQIRQAIGFDEPQRRIAMLLKALEGEWVRSDLIGIVASAGSYQEDWQRRLRDLRFLGWDYEVRKSYGEAARVLSYYRLTKSAPLPDNIPAAIRAEVERRDKAKRRSADTSES
jgi:hypothetical protein